MSFISPLKSSINFGVMAKITPKSGFLAWEYNPFKNYRLQESKYYFRNKYFSKKELEDELGKKIDNDKTNWDDYRSSKLINGIKDDEEDPIFFDKNQLVDFDTSELNFDITHPVDILPLYSYDGSVNLIINDGKNTPKLINSRFSALGKNKYQIVDRKGNNDTNIYDLGELFNSDTSLYKTYIGIPKLEFINVYYNGNLEIGNYHFYFRYADDDGNETDFVAESGLVSIFKGDSFSSINSGFRNEDSHKSVKFLLTNIDPSYQYVNVYYTKATSDINEKLTISAFKIFQKFSVNNSLICQIHITGNEYKTQISLSEINPIYLIYQSVETQTSCQNMLFFGNIKNYNINYLELADISLRFKVTPDTSKTYIPVPHDYNNIIENTYSDPKFIYNFTGYLNHEIYRFGIVYLLNNGLLSPVFNVRGMYFNSSNPQYTEFELYKGKQRNYITYNEDTGIIYKSNGDSKPSSENLENAFGVVRIDIGNKNELNTIIGINIEASENLKEELKKYNVKGYFFVRLKRIPLRISQAFTIGIDGESKTPVLYTNSNVLINSESKQTSDTLYIAERFLSDERKLVHNFEDRLFGINPKSIYRYGAICPEYDVNSPTLNTLFCGDNYIIELASESSPLLQDVLESRHFYIDDFSKVVSENYVKTKIVGVEDNVKLVGIDNKMFSARAGEAEESFRYEYINSKIKSTNSNNLIRGSFGPYLALDGYSIPGTLINIYIKDYIEMNRQELFKLRISDKSPYYAISDRYSLSEFLNSYILYRGDSYICTFTHRLNRNFQDPSAPVNHKIVDENCWKNNYEVSDGVVKKENFDKINLGDVNAIKLGMWVTFPLISSINLNIRSLDNSIPDEEALFGHPRGFYPYFSISAEGSFKIPEALCYNLGFNVFLSQRSNFETPDVPAIKNDFTNRISYSDINVNDAFKNGFRIFQGSHYRDYPKTYGLIIKLIELQGNLLCVLEHGVALIPVNERALAGEGLGGNIYINTSNVLPENPKILSDTFGSQWKDSIIKTPRGIYGVDTVSKKIWRTNGLMFECISDFRVLEFLNNNISLSEREITPIIGIRNVKTHYNKYKGDVMFTFYDDLYGSEEKVWNLCYNEILQKWITFYSWVPSFSENIHNNLFSFNRDVSKYISKLGMSKFGNNISNEVTVKDYIISSDNFTTNLIYNKSSNVSFKLLKDDLGHYKLFDSKLVETNKQLSFIGKYEDIKSEFYKRNNLGELILDENKKPIYLDYDNLINPNKIIIQLNLLVKDENKEFISKIALISKYNLQFLNTNFWKHGESGVIDISENITPTHWYGKQHPFEFEFVVVDNPQIHKIFDNLEIISNNAEPESFHYEIIGDCYDFAKDKKNMYIRLEATKELYQLNGTDILYDHGYINLNEKLREIKGIDGRISKYYDKSTILPLYYSRQDSVNEIEDFYHLKNGEPQSKNFSALAGGEIVYYNTLDEYRIWNHAKAVDINDGGRMRGNMQYKEDKWDIQINPLNLVLKNETKWKEGLVPVEINLSPLPNDVLDYANMHDGQINIPEDFKGRDVVRWNWEETQMKESKLKDKWIKIRIRYSGKKLAIITAIKTLYSISYA